MVTGRIQQEMLQEGWFEGRGLKRGILQKRRLKRQFISNNNTCKQLLV
jgi:hypothetical protein